MFTLIEKIEFLKTAQLHDYQPTFIASMERIVKDCQAKGTDPAWHVGHNAGLFIDRMFNLWHKKQAERPRLTG
jgi:hypothetical protein